MTATSGYYGTGTAGYYESATGVYMTSMPVGTTMAPIIARPENFRVLTEESVFSSNENERRFILAWDPVPGADYYNLRVQAYLDENNVLEPSVFSTSSTEYTLTNFDINYGLYYFFLVQAITPDGYESRPARLTNGPENGWFFKPPDVKTANTLVGTATANFDIQLSEGVYDYMAIRIFNQNLNFDETFTYNFNNETLQQISLSAHDGLTPTEKYSVEIWTQQNYPFKPSPIKSNIKKLDIKLEELGQIKSKMNFRNHNTIQLEYTPIEGATAYTIVGIDLSKQTKELKSRRLDQANIEFYDLSPGGQYKFQIKGFYGKKESPMTEFTVSTTPAPIKDMIIIPSATDIKVKFKAPEGKALAYEVKLIDAYTDKIVETVKLQSYLSDLIAVLPAEPDTDYIVQATSHMPSLTSVPAREKVRTKALANLSEVLIATDLDQMQIQWSVVDGGSDSVYLGLEVQTVLKYFGTYSRVLFLTSCQILFFICRRDKNFFKF